MLQNNFQLAKIILSHPQIIQSRNASVLSKLKALISPTSKNDKDHIQLSKILPKKKFIKRQLFDLDSRYTYKRIIPVYKLFYESIKNKSELKIPRYIDGSDLMIMKRILENYRVQSNLIIKNLVNLENELLEAAAELHDNNAISILAFETLLDKNSNNDDKKSARSLIKSLFEINHPLTIKNLGDLAFNFKNYLNAEYYYLTYLDLISKLNPNSKKNYNSSLIFINSSNTNTIAETYKQLGILNFQKPNISLAKQFFTQSILTLNTYTTNNSNTVQSHYYLAQIYSRTNPKLSRYHLEISAQSAFKESFKDLGFLELNYFNNPIKALEWFKLGYDLNDNDINHLIGEFDCYILLNDYTEARSTYDSLKKSILNNFKNKELFKNFLKSRSDSLSKIEINSSELIAEFN